MANDERKLQEIDTLMGKPVFIGYDTKTQIVRTQLFLFSTIAIVFGAYDFQIVSETSFLGVKFKGLSTDVFNAVMTTALGYLMVHFVWLSIEAFQEWRIRLTGSTQVYSSGSSYGSGYEDYTDNPRQSTLYNFVRSHFVKNRKDGFSKNTLSNRIAWLEGELLKIPETERPKDWSSTQQQIKELQNILTDGRLVVSIKRFDRWLPLVLGFTGITLLHYR
jgi:hypothetical protein